MTRNLGLLALTIALPVAFAGSGPALAADRWEEAAGGAVAILPAPTEARIITGGSLYCAEQKWAFRFRTESPMAIGGPVKIGIEGRNLTFAAVETPGMLEVAIPTELLDSLKAGSRMRISVGEGDTPAAEAIFGLRNSTKVIEAIAPRCSQIDMSAYEAVALVETDPAVNVVRDLFADEIKLFRAATGRQPTVTAIQIEPATDKKLLFGALCGSTSYYGTSGCTLAGWAATAASAEWRQVYATEGVRLYFDAGRARDGWPGLATLPHVSGTEAVHWTWTGDVYEAEDGALLADDETIAQGDADQ